MKISEVNALAREWLAASQEVAKGRGSVPSMLWIDVETTGLDPRSDVLLEVGLLVTDQWGAVIPGGSLSRVIKPEDFAAKIKEADDFVKNMHNSNGLIKEVWRTPASESPVAVDGELAAFVEQFFGDEKVPLAGSSVHFDRKFAEVHLPKFVGAVSYRNVDISTLKELHSMVSPGGEAHRKKVLKPWRSHRATPDLIDTIEEYMYYLEDFLWTKHDQSAIANFDGNVLFR